MSRFIGVLLCLIFLVISVTSHGHGQAHPPKGSHGHSHDHLHQRIRPRTTATTNLTTSTAEELVKEACLAAADRNKARLENPRFNIYEVLPTQPHRDFADLLDYGGRNSSRIKRQAKGNSTSSSGYTLPPEVIQAAKEVAENTAQTPSGDHAEVAGRIRAKYAHNLPDTNTPKPLKAPEGLLGGWASYLDTAGFATTDANYSSEVKRDAGFWLADLPQRGISPHAPAGYKVWRNVKDYGAKGDGVTDDTEAINRAISDGGRCGPNCGSSTIFPAVVYFPSGTYLISTTIIQYYNTQLLGNPHDLPTILGATSFIGGALITSDVYISDDEEWYLNTNNFLRSIRNFKIDVRNTDPHAYNCGIHWQVAQGTSIENVEFYMRYNSDTPGNTQQGIYMENGSGGFLADLTFVGGNFGAYMGNQQFTTSHLVFVNCETAVQIHWDWAWTMQDFIIESCGTGLAIVGGAGGPKSTGQGVGSLVLVDTIIANTPKGIITSLAAENSTSFLLQNVGFFNVQQAVQDAFEGVTMLAGGNQVHVDSWGFGRINNATGNTTFINGANIPAMTRQEQLLGASYDNMKPNLFTRRRPRYDTVSTSSIMDVKALGAKGDGITDDTAVLNAILDGAANTSSVVYFPFGIYIIKDTLRVPVGSRVIGQVWSQIMASGPKFSDEQNPRVAVQVGRRGDVGIVEIQDMMFTVSAAEGATAGAVIVEWNVRQSDTGSAGMWDSHIRVGGAQGSGLQKEHCPKQTGQVNPKCKAASLLMHLAPNSTAYLENVWIWTADHDMDKVTQDQIDVYAGRGLLIESDLSWLWGTSVEHCVLYQYQISGARNILMSMIQTESPYYQPRPQAPTPFQTGLFANDPTFTSCQDASCASSWAVRIVDSTTIYILGAGLYSWFSDYSQVCLATENCQQKGFEVVESFDLWVYNLCTKAIVEMVSPLLSSPTLAVGNKNGFLSSILAWLQGAEQTSGQRRFKGFQIYTVEDLDDMAYQYPETCRVALTEIIECDDFVETFLGSGYRGSLLNVTLTDSVCNSVCSKSLQTWFENVDAGCRGYLLDGEVIPTLYGGRLWAGVNETCLKEPGTGRYCNDIIYDFTKVADISDMPTNEICSFCYTERVSMMQKTAYSQYDDFYESRLRYINDRCGTAFNTAIPQTLTPVAELPPCPLNRAYVTREGDTCDSIALEHSVASAALFMGNTRNISDCNEILPGRSLCLPLTCAETYVLQPSDLCGTLEMAHADRLRLGDIRRYNPWIDSKCTNLLTASNDAYGRVICLSPQNGFHNLTGSHAPFSMREGNGYGTVGVDPPDASVADGTITSGCALWYVPSPGDTCVAMTIKGPTTIKILLQVNKGLKSAESCNADIIVGRAYCVLPTINWDYDPALDEPLSITTTYYFSTSIDIFSPPASVSTTTTTSGIVSTTSTSESRSTARSTTSTQTSTPTATSVPYHYYGCYTEAIGQRALSASTYADGTSMSIESCAAFCSNYSIFGIEYGSECYCGNALGPGSFPTFETQCNMKCSGNPDAICGAGNRLSLYGVSSEKPVLTPAPSAPNVTDRTYQGCYTEGDGARALGAASIVDQTAMTMEACATYCLQSGFVMFGMEYTSECWCDHQLHSTSVAASEGDCSMECSGDASQKCGGPNRLSVWMWS